MTQDLHNDLRNLIIGHRLDCHLNINERVIADYLIEALRSLDVKAGVRGNQHWLAKELPISPHLCDRFFQSEYDPNRVLPEDPNLYWKRVCESDQAINFGLPSPDPGPTLPT